MLEHGGKLIQASRKYDIDLHDWVDLSTGINPNGWPVPLVPPVVWNRLPEENDELMQAASEYYGSRSFIVTCGSQAGIQSVPSLRKPGRTGIISPTYNEHWHAWRQAGHEVQELSVCEIEHACEELDVVVVCNPNNPTTELLAPEILLNCHSRLSERGGWLVIDEAFIDATPDLSTCSSAGLEGLIIFRSLGKFFGLAGARVGFTFAWKELLLTLQSKLGPWMVTGPSCWVATRALEDKQWQASSRERLLRASNEMALLLCKFGLKPTGSLPFFHWILDEKAAYVHEQLARRGILVRLFEKPSSLRLGTTGSVDQLKLLELALQDIYVRSSGAL